MSELLPGLGSLGFEVEFHSHAEAILSIDFPEVLVELDQTLSTIKIPIDSLVRGGGGEHELTQELRRRLATRLWHKHNFEIKKLIDGIERESISHEVDHVRSCENGKVALEIEWNNKDPFFDRDLENFKRLHAEAAISVGIILTRGTSLQNGLRSKILEFARSRKIKSFNDLVPFGISPTARQESLVTSRLARNGDVFAEAWADVFVSDKFGQATTHWRKLEERVHRGVGNPCPLLLIGIPLGVVTP
ncbi:restriction endonuclease [bacterium]|nr:MAG: restriction endonuclease [bacterium]